MYKKFLKYYKKEFIPITKFEYKDRELSLKRMEYTKSAVFLLFFLVSYQLKKARITFQKGVSPDTIVSNALGSILVGSISYILLHFMLMKVIFDKNFYIRNRILYEKSINYERQKYDKDNLLDEYPFTDKHKLLYSDFSIKNQLYLKNESVSGNEEVIVKKKKNSRLFGPNKSSSNANASNVNNGNNIENNH